MQPSTLAKRVFPFAFLAILLFYLYGLGQLPLVGPDEPRYAQVAREMFLRHDWITPTLGGHNWFEKPALLYWLMIVAYKLFGVSEWSARLGPAVCGLLTIAAIWFVARQVDENNGVNRVAALVASSSLGLIVFARGASFDIVVTMTIAWALAFFLSNEIKSRWTMLAGFYVFVGLSLIAKGLVGVVVPFGIVTLYYALRRELPRREVWVSLIWGGLITCAVAAVWYGPVISRHGRTFIDQFFIQHHLARYISNKYHHPQPFYFYLPIIALMALPWTNLLVEALAQLRPVSWRDESPASKIRIFALAWLVWPILFFSFSGSKLPGYILPALPGAALLIGEVIIVGYSKWTMRVAGVVCLALAIAGAVYASTSHASSLATAILVTSPLLAGGILSLLWPHQRVFCASVIGFSTVLTLALVLHVVAPQLAQRESVRELIRLADQRGYGDDPVFARAGSDRTAEFYAATRVVYDEQGEPVTLDEIPKILDAARDHGGRILVIIPSDYTSLVARLSGIEVIGTNGHVALIAASAN